MDPFKVNNIEELKQLLEQGKSDFFIALLGGALRSSKYLTWDGVDTFYLLHYIDDYEEVLTEEELMKSNIGEALRHGALYCG